MKKLFSRFFILLLCMALLTACTSQENSTATDKSTAASTADVPASTTDKNRPSLLKNNNVNLPGVLPIVKEMETLTVGIAQNANTISYKYEDNYQTKWMQDHSNVKLELELFPAADAKQKLDLMISSNSSLPDVLVQMGIDNDTTRYKYGMAGAIIPLDEYYDQLGCFFDQALVRDVNNSDFMSKEDLFKYVRSPDGKTYGTLRYIVSEPDSYVSRVWMNQKWLKALNLSEPKTTEELVNVLRAFRDNDPNQNKKKDEIPMVGYAGGWNTNPILWLMNSFIYIDGTAYDKEEWRVGLRFIKSLVDEGLLSTLSFTQDSSQYKAMVSTEEQIVGVAVSASISFLANNKADYEALGVIEGPKGAKWATFTPQLPVCVAAITRDCKSPDLAFRWLEMGYESYDAYMIQRFGEPDVEWKYVNTGKTLSDAYKPFFVNMNSVKGIPQQKLWGATVPLPVIATSIVNQGQVFEDLSNNEYKNATAVAKQKDYIPDKEDVIYKIIYTPEEIDQYSELRSVLKGYIDESMVRFVMGELNLDKDWDKYLSELEKLKYKQILSVDQSAYNRTIGK